MVSPAAQYTTNDYDYDIAAHECKELERSVFKLQRVNLVAGVCLIRVIAQLKAMQILLLIKARAKVLAT